MFTKRSISCFSLLGILIVTTLLMSACELTDRPTEICAGEEEHPTFEVVFPAVFTVIDTLRPTIIWALNEGATCVPDHYNVQVWSVKNYLPGATAGYLIVAGTTTTEFFEWPSEAPSLLPGTAYMIIVSYDFGDSGYVQRYHYFSTGPICSATDPVSAPRLQWPPDNWRVDPTVMMEFEWNSTMSCWPAHNYFIEISESDDFTDPIFQTVVSQGEIQWIHPSRALPWENCTRYYWHVRPYEPGSEEEWWSDTWSFKVQPGDMLCPIEIPLITPIPPAFILTMVDLNCRSGPTLDYPILSVLPAAASYEIRGRNQAGDAWQVLDPAIGAACWVAADLVELTGDTAFIPIIDPQPPAQEVPTDAPTVVDCSQWNSDQQACIANDACTWQPNLYPESPCRNK